jgi:chemotaxis protein MotA
MAGKLKMRTREEVHLKLLMLEGALAIQQGMNPKLVRERLLVFMPHGGGHGAKAGGADAGEAAA